MGGGGEGENIMSPLMVLFDIGSTRVCTHMTSLLSMASPKQVPVIKCIQKYPLSLCVQCFKQIAQPPRSNMYNAMHTQIHT